MKDGDILAWVTVEQGRQCGRNGLSKEKYEKQNIFSRIV